MAFPSCPYCHQSLHLDPKRSVKCRSCGKTVCVRSTNQLFDHHPLTAKEAGAADSFRDLLNYGVVAEDFHRARRELENQFGHSPLPGDVIWRLWHEVLLSSPGQARQIYYSMALTLAREGRSPHQILRLSARASLEEFQRTGIVSAVRILPAGNGCSTCARLDGVVLTIAEALDSMPIPEPHCTHQLFDDNDGFCRCIYIAEGIGL